MKLIYESGLNLVQWTEIWELNLLLNHSQLGNEYIYIFVSFCVTYYSRKDFIIINMYKMDIYDHLHIVRTNEKPIEKVYVSPTGTFRIYSNVKDREPIYVNIVEITY